MIFLVFAGSLVTSLVLVGLMRRVALRTGLIDVPNSRSSHASPRPRGGGLAIALVVLTGVAASGRLTPGAPEFWVPWFVGGVMVAGAGFVDDVRGLSAPARAAIHLLAAVIVMKATGGLPPFASPGGAGDLGLMGWVVGAVGIVWSINSFNFMDGIDGLAAAQAVFLAVCGAGLMGTGGDADSVRFSLYALAGSAAGFLWWNFPPARIFMGDVGSGFIGFSLAAAAVFSVKAGDGNLWTWIILDGLFIADATTTLVTRLLRGERFYEAHRSHVYQRLARRWASHRKVTLLYAAVNVVWCLPWAVAAARLPASAPLVAALALVPLFVTAVAAGAGRSDPAPTPRSGPHQN
jgi:Fuc2NAc and GlcNAc transferase